MLDEVVVEYHGKAYTIGVLLIGSAQSKLRDEALAERLEEAIEGRREAVVLEDADCHAFYLAARSISVSFDRENLDWQRLLAELHADCATERRGGSRSQILASNRPS